MNMCEKCGKRYAPANPIRDLGLCRVCTARRRNTALSAEEIEALEQAEHSPSIQDLSAILLRQYELEEKEAPREKRDFFISYHGSRLEHALRLDEILRSMGKSTYIFGQAEASGTTRKDAQAAIDQSERIVCLVSRGYFESQYCRDELDAFWVRPDRQEERRVLFLELDSVRIPRAYRSTLGCRLGGLTTDAYETKVRAAIESADRKFADYGVHEQRDEPWAEYLGSYIPPLPAKFKPMAAAAAILLAVGYYLTYFQSGPHGVWDPREAATYAAIGRDISLPWNWTVAAADLREYVFAERPDATEYWRRANGRATEFTKPGQYLQPVGLSMLKNTLAIDPQGGTVEEGIAQYRAVFVGGSIKVLADAQADGEAYHGFRVDNDVKGALVASYFEKLPGRSEATLTRLATKQMGAGATLHDIGISKKDGLLTLWHNRSVMATWPTLEGRGPSWRGGAFGLAANGAQRSKLFRWSVAANREGGPTLLGSRGRRVISPPELLSFAAPVRLR